MTAAECKTKAIKDINRKRQKKQKKYRNKEYEKRRIERLLKAQKKRENKDA